MTPPLFLLDPLPSGDEFVLAGPEGHHAARVRRVRPDETVLVSDGRGTVLHGLVVSIAGDEVTLRVLARTSAPPPQPRLVVVQALPKGDRAELAVETMTELEVDVIVPWSASRSITQWTGPRGDKALGRWRRTAAEAAKQSRRPRLPDVTSLATTPEVTGRIVEAAAAIVLHEEAGTGVGEIPLPGAGDLVLIVGPEGGIAPDELEQFKAVGAVAARLGPAVLRTSTAGPAALSALSLRLGRWS